MVLRWLKKNKSEKQSDASAKEAVREPVGNGTTIHSGKGVDIPLSAAPPASNTEDDNTPEGTPAPVDPDENTPIVEAAAERTSSFFGRLRLGLSKTRKILTTDLDELFAENKKFGAEMLEDLEGILITADIGVPTTMRLMQSVSRKASIIKNPATLIGVLKEEILSLLPEGAPSRQPIATKPRVIMVVGVNGVGKTTTIGKLAARYRSDNLKVLIAAADTFRAAAVEQLSVWADRSGADIVKHKGGADPAAVAFDAVKAASAREVDIVLVDTAGRLHTKVNLMEELRKIKRSIAKILPDAPHDILLVLDATTGQNALSQAKMFDEALGVTGIALTKLDGTAKGGIVIGIYDNLNIPLQYIGVGEKIEDLQNFEPRPFVDALF
jgi:fused signal recognition particle receptor